MKQAATGVSTSIARSGSRPKIRHASNSAFDLSRNWELNYEGLPNTTITDVKVEGESAIITLQTADGSILNHRISRLEYVVGRRGSLRYLSRSLRREVCGVGAVSSDSDSDSAEMLSGQTLRNKVLEDLEVAPHVFAIGSLTGDSLIRFAYGSCTYAAGRIMAPAVKGIAEKEEEEEERHPRRRVNGVVETDEIFSDRRPAVKVDAAPKVMNGLDGHHGGGSVYSSHIFGAALDRRKV